MKLEDCVSLLLDDILEYDDCCINLSHIESVDKIKAIMETHLKLFLVTQLEAKIKEYDSQITFYSQKMFGSPAEKEYEIRKSELENLLTELL